MWNWYVLIALVYVMFVELMLKRQTLGRYACIYITSRCSKPREIHFWCHVSFLGCFYEPVYICYQIIIHRMTPLQCCNGYRYDAMLFRMFLCISCIFVGSLLRLTMKLVLLSSGISQAWRRNVSLAQIQLFMLYLLSLCGPGNMM